MTSGDLIERSSITEVWHALGGGPLRRGRAQAFWRNGDSDNVALDEDRSIWFDHAHRKGGGILDLIQTVLGCGRQDALHWLADHLGITLDDRQPLASDERRVHAQRRTCAESAAADLTAWRRRLLRRMGEERNRLYISENAVSAVGRTLLAETGAYGNENAWTCIWKRVLDDQRGDETNRQIEAFEKATVRELIAMRQQWEGRSA